MSEKFDSNNGYNSSDFKRNSNQDMQGGDADRHDQDGDDGAKINDKAGEYMRELLSEKIKLNTAKFPYATKLIDQGDSFYKNCSIIFFCCSSKLLF